MTTDAAARSNSRKVPYAYRVARIAAFSALSVVGSFIHPLPSLVPSVALDSAPGFFVALYFGPLDGFCVTGLGHVATALVNGLPLGILHAPIALGLAVAGGVVGIINRKWHFLPAVAAGIAINTGLVVLAIPVYGLGATISFAPTLFLASCIDGALGTITYLAVRRRLKA
jgi:riboflavin transporter